MRDVKCLQPQRRGQVGQQAVIQDRTVGQIEVLHGGAQLADAQDAAGAHVQRTAHLVSGHMRDEEKAGQGQDMTIGVPLPSAGRTVANLIVGQKPHLRE